MSLKDFEKEKTKEFTQKFPFKCWWGKECKEKNKCEVVIEGKRTLSFLLTSLRQSYTLGQEEERKAWVSHKRCEHCGESKKGDPLWRLCEKCTEYL